MIRITEEYRIAPGRNNPLRHFPCATGTAWYMYGAPTRLSGKECLVCNKKTPKKILFIYNLWKFHND